MPIVFVHGVNTREGPGYKAETLAISAFLQKHLSSAAIAGRALPPAPAVSFPYWGDLGTAFAWNMASLPRPEMQELGGSGDIALQPLLAHIRDAFPDLPEQQPLIALAKRRLPLAVEVINELALANAAQGTEREVADFVVQASAFAEANPQPAWLANVQTDEALLTELSNRIQPTGGPQALGGFGTVFNKIRIGALKLKDGVKKMAGKAVDKAGNFASTKLLAATRDSLNETLGRFFGDIFIYFNGRGDATNPGAIPKMVLHAFDEVRAEAPNEPLVILGHSLGGVITMDLLSYFRPDINVDLFISVGSQVAHFEELKLYRASDKMIKPPQKAKTPVNIKHWINVFDPVDIFSYSADRIFDRIDVDAPYDTETYTIKAHSAYFQQDRFYQRLRARIEALP